MRKGMDSAAKEVSNRAGPPYGPLEKWGCTSEDSLSGVEKGKWGIEA